MLKVISLLALLLANHLPGLSPVDVQREAMRRLVFLRGHWSGPASVTRGPDQVFHLTQSEDVEYKLGGLVLLIEGKSTDDSGKIVFNALATIAYDDAAHVFRMRAYNDRHYVDTELSVLSDGFSWGFTAGPAHITNTMRLTHKGEWAETTEVTIGTNPPHKSVEMLLRLRP